MCTRDGNLILELFQDDLLHIKDLQQDENYKKERIRNNERHDEFQHSGCVNKIKRTSSLEYAKPQMYTRSRSSGG